MPTAPPRGDRRLRLPRASRPRGCPCVRQPSRSLVNSPVCCDRHQAEARAMSTARSAGRSRRRTGRELLTVMAPRPSHMTTTAPPSANATRRRREEVVRLTIAFCIARLRSATADGAVDRQPLPADPCLSSERHRPAQVRVCVRARTHADQLVAASASPTATAASLFSARRSIWRTRSPLRPSRSPTLRSDNASPPLPRP